MGDLTQGPLVKNSLTLHALEELYSSKARSPTCLCVLYLTANGQDCLIK
uniref:Uncharacterized protein n=1 Tax=Anguilla anguilla TaxID=7936 RepID=A0A0E9SD47_ANGAN